MWLRRAWVEELQHFVVIVTVTFIAGLILDAPLLGIIGGLCVYLARLLVGLREMAQWASNHSEDLPPDVPGVAGLLASTFVRQTRSNSELHESLLLRIDRLRTAIHALPDAIVDLDEELHIAWCNEQATRLLGVRPVDDQGRPIDNLVRHPDFIAILRAGEPDKEISIPSPSRPNLSLRIKLLPYGDGQSVLLARDETESVRLEQMRQDFISNVSHELKTPLTVLRGYLETMEDDAGDLPEAWQRPTRAMSDQTNRMTQLVEDLLLLSRIESVDRPAQESVVDVPTLLAEILEEARIVSGARTHRLRADIEPGVGLVGSSTEIRAAFVNLVVNAVQHTPADGDIWIRWTQTESEAHFSVRDSGEGIEEHHIGRLTERFYRADAGRSRDQGGTGLGLAIVKHVLQHYDATLHIASTVGDGSTFRCVFPADRIVRLPADDVDVGLTKESA